MVTYRTPDVYVEEISTFPPSVAEVETAIPAFIGYTEKAEKDGIELLRKPTKIKSMLEYQLFFGDAPSRSVTVVFDDENGIKEVSSGANSYNLYDSLRLYFDNGGGPCYIVSVGDYKTPPALGTDTSGILSGLKKLSKEDEPTIILCPDAASLAGSIDLYDFQQKALMQCAALQDRVLLCDLKNTSDFDAEVKSFRDNIGINNLKYGACYAPWIRANFARAVPFRDITFKRGNAPVELDDLTTDPKLKKFITKQLKAAISATNTIKEKVVEQWSGSKDKSLKEKFVELRDQYTASRPYASVDAFQDEVRAVYTFLVNILHAIVKEVYPNLPDPANPDTDKFNLRTDLKTILLNSKAHTALKSIIENHNATIGFAAGKILDTAGTTLSETITEMNSITGSTITAADADDDVDEEYSKAGLTADQKGDIAMAAAAQVFSNIHTAVLSLISAAETYEKTFNDTLPEVFGNYKAILKKISDKMNELPPSGAIAGVYATVDRDRGVWKAPANISLSSVIEPVIRLDSKDQENLNIDVNSGKSINAIRPFTGKGILVWGARTLAGNDNEWRYVSVRRFFNMVEESVKKSTAWAVFEPNDANTWIKVKSMIENYLIQKWREGALVGAKADDAFFVKLGLGVTMTAQDILEGRMNVEIGMAVVRPAEFIVLKFSHKMQKS